MEQNSCSQAKTSAWLPDLVSLGYAEPLYASSPAVQASLAAISDPEVHRYIQESDRAALEDRDDEGEPAPTLLATLDLSHWTAIMSVATESGEKGLERLKQAHAVLSAILDRDELEMDEAVRNTRSVEVVLRNANPHENWEAELPALAATNLDGTVSTPLNPLLSRMNIDAAHKAAIEDLTECIQNSQAETERAALEASGKGPSIPFLPPRAVEEQLGNRNHRTWCLSNINFLAPISIPMWKTWAFISDDEVKACEGKALSYEGLLKEGVLIPNAFPLAMFDHHKCTTIAVQVLCKQDMLTVNPRHKKFSSSFWNIQRPYIRCCCEQNAASGCKGTMLWFDHAVWFMLNHLDRFFDDAYPNLAAKFGAFIAWMSTAARVAVRYQITFMTLRRMMEDAALEATVNPTGKLLAKHYEAPGARQIEKYIKPASFSLEMAPSPSPATTKRRKLNMNVAPTDKHYVQPQMRDAPRSGYQHAQARRGRGGYNKNYRPYATDNGKGNQFMNKRGQDHEHRRGQNNNRSHRDSDSRTASNILSPIRQQRGMPEEVILQTPPSMSMLPAAAEFPTSSNTGTSSVVIKPWTSPIKGRILDWSEL